MIWVLSTFSDVLDAFAVSIDGQLPVYHAPDPASVLSRIGSGLVSVAVVDMRSYSPELVEELQRSAPHVPVIAVVPPSDTTLAFECADRGAVACVDTRLSSEAIRVRVSRALLRSATRPPPVGHLPIAVPDLVGASPAMRALHETIERVAATDLSVLVRGETGVGKELVASAIHARSRRAGGPFVAFNAAAVAPALFESELFGAVPGAFTGARPRAGLIRTADGGTLFLDEVSELPLDLQPKLLRALDRRVVIPVGSDREEQIDVRVVAAGNRDFLKMLSQNLFRRDLWHRLAAIIVHVPPLRDRLEDIPALVTALLARHGYAGARLTDGALSLLAAEPWPGNVRELENVLVRSVALSGRALVRRCDVRFDAEYA